MKIFRLTTTLLLSLITFSYWGQCNLDSSFIASVDTTNSLNYTFSVNDSSNTCSFLWDFGDNNASTAAMPSHIYSQAGTYIVNLIIGACDSTCYDTISQFITVINIAPCNVSANYQWYQLYDSLNGSWLNTVYVINFSTIGSNLNYFWDFGDGATSNLFFPSHTYSNIGDYSVCLTITDNQSCTATYCDSIYVRTKSSGFTLNVISQEEASVGIEEKAPVELGNIYPNPTSDNASINITAKENSVIFIRIIDLSGKVISNETKTINIGDNTIQLNTANLTKGMYFVSISSRENINKNLRLIKNKNKF